MCIKSCLPITALVLASFLSGCGGEKNRVTGAYEALIQAKGMEPHYVGVMVIQNTKIWADGDSVEVASWQFNGPEVIATGADGTKVMTFQERDEMLVQIAPDGSELILRKIEL